MLISLDGIDGCGKSTQIRMLKERTGAEAIQEISDSVWGRRLRGSTDPSLAQQVAWFTADRAGLSARLTEAARSSTKHLISDRCYLSGVAYQSYDTPLTPSFLEDLWRALVPEYDAIFVLHLPVGVSLDRVDKRGEGRTWCEDEGRLTWASRVFEAWAARRENIHLIDATQTPDEVHGDIWRIAAPLFG